MFKIDRNRLMLLLAGGVLASVATGFLLYYGVVLAGALVAVLCLAALLASLPRWWKSTGPNPVHTDQPEKSPRNIPVPTKTKRSAAPKNNERSLVDQMLAQGRFALLLRPQISENLTAVQFRTAHEILDAAMAVVPKGPVIMRSSRLEEVAEENRHKVERKVDAEGYYLDRFPVTNGEYQEFVDAGGYEQLQLWDEDIWPAMLQFTDRTGQSGPRMWENGRYPAGKEDHPVVGVCWFEANAYARWAGKRLPSDVEWVKAAVWPVTAEGSRLMQRKYPWGDAMDRTLANLWGSGPDDTVPVTQHSQGASVGGVQQLVGNVWEWTSTNFGAWEPAAVKLETDIPLKSLRGGAYDTYFDAQAQCQFQSGDSPLARKNNIGFRCAVGFSDVMQSLDEASPVSVDDELREPGFSPAVNEAALEEEVFS